MKITDKIRTNNQFMIDNQENGEGLARAKQLQGLAIKAMFNGIRSRDWETYMRQIADMDNPDVGPRQLRRLLGEDPDYMDTQWANETLAYLVANATCTSQTFMRGGTLFNLSEDMIGDLDAGFE